jgi:hypothetical protein
MKKEIISKGYTITVVSWENDGDHYNTESMTVNTLEKALALYNLMMMCDSQSTDGLGNAIDFTDKEINRIIQFFKDNPVLVYDRLDEFYEDYTEEDMFLDLFHEYTERLMGGSEDYSCRVMESCDVIYSEEDIFVDMILSNNKK